MTDVFISYSRKNSDFARRLIDRLNQRGKDAWVDWEGIPLTSPNWWNEIKSGIEATDSFVFIMSPDSMASVVCNMELDYAIELHKRLVPVVYQNVVTRDAFASVADFEPDEAMQERLDGKDPLIIARDNWQRLSHINWVFFRPEDNFDKSFDRLLTTVETDLPYVRAHTRYLTRAQEWQRENQREDLLLFGSEIDRAEAWLKQAENYIQQQAHRKNDPVDVVNPLPQSLHRDFIQRSRKAEQRRRLLTRSAQISIAVLALVLLAGGTLSVTIVSDTSRQVVEAKSTFNAVATDIRSAQNFASALQLAARAQEMHNNGDQSLSLRLALDASYIDPLPQTERILSELAYQPGARRRFVGHNGTVNLAVFSPDGSKIISGGCSTIDSTCTDGELFLWDAASGTILRKFEGYNGAVYAVAFSPDGKTIVAGSKNLIMWDVASGQILQHFVTQYNYITSVAFSPDGSMIASGACNTADFICPEGELALWESTNGSNIRALSGDEQGITSLAFSPDGQTLVSASSNRQVVLSEVATGNILRTFTANSAVFSVAFNPDGRSIAIPSLDGSLTLWDIESGSQLRSFQGAISWTTSVSFSPDAKILASASCLAIAEGCQAGGEIILWDVATGNILRRFRWNPSTLNTVAFSPNGQNIIIAGYDSTLILADVSNGSMLLSSNLYGATIMDVAFSPDGQSILYGSSSGDTTLWDIPTNTVLQNVHPQNFDARDVAFSFDGHMYIVGGCLSGKKYCSEGEITIYDTVNGNLLRRLYDPNSGVDRVANSPNGQYIIAASSNGDFVLWDVAAGTILKRVNAVMENASTLFFTPDVQQVFATSYDGKLVFWNPTTGEITRLAEDQKYGSSRSVYNPNTKQLLSTDQTGNMTLWDITTGQVLTRFEGQGNRINNAIFSVDNRMILTGYEDGNLILWDASTGEIIRRFEQQTDGVRGMAFSPDGQSFVTGSAFGTLVYWRNDSLDQLQAWTIANRYLPELSCSQRSSFGLPNLCVDQTPPPASALISTRTPYPLPTIPVWTPIIPITSSPSPAQ
ncbi:MAG: PQQ-binding-like beta-propeller repeat protein [Anaerolineaceae bacterium]|nr:PQQ-binding-like beta-propeller repeat protein [Anaerolineaceae bacterium]